MISVLDTVFKMSTRTSVKNNYNIYFIRHSINEQTVKMKAIPINFQEHINSISRRQHTFKLVPIHSLLKYDYYGRCIL